MDFIEYHRIYQQSHAVQILCSFHSRIKDTGQLVSFFNVLLLLTFTLLLSPQPWMALINALVLFLYALVLRLYRWTASDLQRLDAVSRSPIQAALAEGLDGSTTIKAYRKNDFFANMFRGFINDNSSAMLNYVASRRWLAVRLEVLGAFVTLAAGLFITLMYTQLGLTAGLAGLLLMWSNSFTVTLGFLITAFSEAEAAITSIERMHSLEMLPQEKSMVTAEEFKVDRQWPRLGKLEFKDVCLRYRPGLPLSLDGLSFTLQHGSRCAIVGKLYAHKM